MADDDDDENNVALAFGLVTIAGSATAIGASVVFFPTLCERTNSQFLAGSLALAAGVMIFISLVDLMEESREEFEEAGYEEGDVTLYVMLSLFSGFATVWVLDYVVHKVLGLHNHDSDDGACEAGKPLSVDITNPHKMPRGDESSLNSAGDPSSVLLEGSKTAQASSDSIVGVMVRNPSIDPAAVNFEQMNTIGVKTAAAVFLHNFPEGLAVFIAALTDYKAGVALCIAIALHNIPEGLVVAIPIYYGTGRKWYAFFIATMSGFAQVAGGALGYAVLKDQMTDTVFGILYGWIAGIMTVIAFKELLPAARRFDPEDKITTFWLFFGFVFMAVTIILLDNTGPDS